MKTESLDYSLNDQTFVGMLARDSSQTGKRPGVLVVHEAWGLGSHARQRTERIAELGYVALGVDMFGDGQIPETQEGLQMIGELKKNLPVLRERIRVAFDTLAGLPDVDSSRIGSIGFCFGGTVSLELARSGAPVNAVVSFHGDLSTLQPAEPNTVRSRILVCTGAEDPFIPLAKVEQFIAEMTNAKADFEVNVYGGAKHSFTVPEASERGIDALAYNQQADERSWESMKALFEDAFR